jgi:hypothetical protein
MKKIVKVKTNKKTGDGYLDIEEFKDFVDIEKVHSYKLTEHKNKVLSIEFFDKEGNLIKGKM